MKPETQKVAVFVLFLAILSVVIYYLVFNGKPKKPAYIPNPNMPDQNANINANTGTGTANTNTALFPLKKGMNDNKYVLALQKGMNQKYFTKLKEDGDFGDNTQKAVEKHLDEFAKKAGYKALPSKIGVVWSLFTSLKFDKLV